MPGFSSFADARQVSDGETIDCDVCIVGAGAAGITIAREFANTHLRVCLLEAGGLNIDPAVDALSQVDDAGRPYGAPVDDWRLRQFGGSTNHWGGQCAPFHPINFETRDWIPESGWPYGYDELEPYYRRAHEVLGLGEFDYDAQRAADALGVSLFPFDTSKIFTALTRYNRVRFGLTFGEDINSAGNIRVFLNAEVLRFDLKDSSSAVECVSVSSTARNAFAVTAKQFILAGGGIENPRLLLLSNQQRPAGLGNHSDHVGRYFQEHIWYSSGHILPNPSHALNEYYAKKKYYNGNEIRFHLTLPRDVVETLRIGQFRAEIGFGMLIADHAKAIKDGNFDVDDVLELLRHPVDAGHLARCRLKVAPQTYVLGNFVEQVPNPESRVMLSDERDAFGRPHPQLRWQLSALDHEGIVKAHQFIAREVGRSGMGRMLIQISEDPEFRLPLAHGAGHHMGTTRMSTDPKRGVTDGNGRVHHVDNLYVAGSSLFPTSDWPNPTLTIVATALRLAQHVKSIMTT